VFHALSGLGVAVSGNVPFSLNLTATVLASVGALIGAVHYRRLR
jgi:hypothetical protein